MNLNNTIVFYLNFVFFLLITLFENSFNFIIQIFWSLKFLLIKKIQHDILYRLAL